jgi:hypothetical protein
MTPILEGVLSRVTRAHAEAESAAETGTEHGASGPPILKPEF